MTEQIQRNVAAIAELEKNVDAQRSRSMRVGAAIVGFVGTMSFAVCHVVGIGAWVYVNRLNSPWQFDPYPWPVLILILAVEAIVLSAFVLLTQRHQTRVADRRSHLNLQISLIAEAEMTKVLNVLRAISMRLGLPDEADDEALQEMAKETDVEHVAQVIDKQLEDDAAVKTDKTPGQ
jgi:uncharacterized membrane protein